MAAIQTKEQRLETLARTLRASGLAHSDKEAQRMAQDMLRTEEDVQKNFNTQHERAQHLLRREETTITQPQTPHPVEDKEVLRAQMIKEMRERATGSMPQEEHTDIDFGKRSLGEAVTQASMVIERQPEHIGPPHPEIQPPEAPEPAPEEEPSPIPEDPPAESAREIPEDILVPDATPAANPPLEPIAQDSASEQPTQQDAPAAAEEEDEESKNQPEKTRIYSDKPKNPKPIEQFEEHKVDLSAIFKSSR